MGSITGSLLKCPAESWIVVSGVRIRRPMGTGVNKSVPRDSEESWTVRTAQLVIAADCAVRNSSHASASTVGHPDTVCNDT